MIELVGGAVALAAMILLLREVGFRATPVITAIAILLILFRAIGLYSDAIGTFSSLLTEGMPSDALEAMLKVTGMTYLFGISSDTCRELGAPGVAKALDLVGRIEIILIALPYVREIVMLGAELV